MELLKVTNIRIEFLKLHTLGDDHIDSSMGTHDSNKKYYYGLYNLVVRGSCFCYGHASMCRPLDGDEHSAAIPGMVHGRCDCEHNTEGMNCEKCKPFYQDVPWQPAKEGDTNQCRRKYFILIRTSLYHGRPFRHNIGNLFEFFSHCYEL